MELVLNSQGKGARSLKGMELGEERGRRDRDCRQAKETSRSVESYSIALGAARPRIIGPCVMLYISRLVSHILASLWARGNCTCPQLDYRLP